MIKALALELGLEVVVCQAKSNSAYTTMEHSGTSDFPLADASIASPSVLLRELQQEKQRLRREKLSAEHLDGEMSAGERAGILARFASGKTLVVCNCGVLTDWIGCAVKSSTGSMQSMQRQTRDYCTSTAPVI